MKLSSKWVAIKAKVNSLDVPNIYLLNFIFIQTSHFFPAMGSHICRTRSQQKATSQFWMRNFSRLRRHSMFWRKMSVFIAKFWIKMNYRNSCRNINFQTAAQRVLKDIPPMDAFLFPGRLRPRKRSASIGRRFEYVYTTIQIPTIQILMKIFIKSFKELYLKI